MIQWKGMLLLFGGIHTVTWELDDLWVFIDGVGWRVIDNDSSRKISQVGWNTRYMARS